VLPGPLFARRALAVFCPAIDDDVFICPGALSSFFLRNPNFRISLDYETAQLLKYELSYKERGMMIMLSRCGHNWERISIICLNYGK